MNKDWIIYVCGIHAAAFAAFHVLFWKIFRWKTSLEQTGKPNKAILQIANVQLIYVFIFITVICFRFTTELYTTAFGKIFLIGIAGFWLIRFIQQFIFLRFNHWLNHTLTILFMVGFFLAIAPLL